MNTLQGIKDTSAFSNGMAMDGRIIKLYKRGPCSMEGCKKTAVRCKRCGDYVCSNGHVSLPSTLHHVSASCKDKRCVNKKSIVLEEESKTRYMIVLWKHNQVWWRKAVGCLLPCWF